MRSIVYENYSDKGKDMMRKRYKERGSQRVSEVEGERTIRER